jgi:hypothetical protein
VAENNETATWVGHRSTQIKIEKFMCEARVNLCPKESRQAPTIFYANQEEGSPMPQKLKDLFFSGSFINQLADTIQEIYLVHQSVGGYHSRDLPAF